MNASENLVLIGLPHYDLANIAAGVAFSADLPGANLTDWEAWSVARIPSRDPRYTFVQADPSMPKGYWGPAPRVGGVAWANHSCALGATARSLLRKAGASAPFLPEHVLPNADYDKVGAWTGSYLSVDDDPFSPDGLAQVSSGDGTGFAGISYDFASPANDPEQGAGAQLFAIRVSWTGSPAPTVAFSLLNAGLIVSSIIYNIPGGPPLQSGQTVIFPWAMHESMSSDGFGVGLRVNFSGMPALSQVSVHAVRWIAYPALDPDEVIGDTGWLPATMDQFDQAWGDTVSGSAGVAPQQTLAHVFPTNVANVAKVVTFFRDPLNTAGFLDLGEMLVGPKFQPLYNRDWGRLVGMEPSDINNDAGGGANFGARGEPRRMMPLPFSWLTPSEAQSLFERAWRAGTLTPFVVAVSPSDAIERPHTTLYCRFRTLPDINAASKNFRGSTCELVEKL